MKKLISIVVILFMCQFTIAQTILGTVIDSELKNPIPYATVIIKNDTGEFVDGTTTNYDGYYKMDIVQGNYEIEVSFMGFITYTDSLTISTNGTTNLKIELKTDKTVLDEVVVVTAEKTTVEQLIDKKVINVGKDILSAGGSAATVLSQLSEVRADENGNISLRGSKNVNVLVNGKPSPLSTAELLKQIPASEINKIEIITSPSAKYQANGLTGIVNILTKKKIIKGVTFTVNSSLNSLGSYNAGSNITLGRNKTNLRLGGSYDKNIYESIDNDERTGIQPYIQKNDHNFDGDFIRFNAGLDWFPNKNDEFSTDISYTNNGHILNNENILIQNNITRPQNSVSDHLHKTFTANVNYRHLFNKDSHYLEFDAQISDNKNTLTGNFNPNYNVLDNATNNTVFISNIAIDYVNKINDKFEIEAGFLSVNDALNNELKSYDDKNQIQDSDVFSNKQSVNALYSLAKIKLSKFNIQVGLRGEDFLRNADLKSDNVKIKNRYTNLFPSLHVKYTLNDELSFVFGYNRRTSRPHLYNLNPIVSQSDEFQIHQGNPNLEPEFSNNFEVSTRIKKGKFIFSPSSFYRLKDNIIIHVNNINNNGTSVSTYKNQDKSSAYGAEFNVTVRPVKWLSSDFDVNLNYEILDNPNENQITNRSNNYSVSFRNQITVSKKVKINASWFYYGPGIGFYHTNESLQRVNLGIRYTLFENATLSFSANDIFNTYEYRGTLEGDGFKRTLVHNPKSQTFNLSFSYFLSSKNKQKQRNKKKRTYDSGILD